MRLVETLLKSGALWRIGTQSHINADLAPGAIGASMRDLASLGLPIHVSELDISLIAAAACSRSDEQLERRQARLAGEMAEAFMALRLDSASLHALGSARQGFLAARSEGKPEIHLGMRPCCSTTRAGRTSVRRARGGISRVGRSKATLTACSAFSC